jgi:hypothetical protein
MLFHTLDDEGVSSWSGSVAPEGEIVFDLYLHYSAGKKLIAYTPGAKVAGSEPHLDVEDAVIEGRFYSETDADYDDLETGDDLSSVAGTYERYLIRVTGGATAAALNRHIRLKLEDI